MALIGVNISSGCDKEAVAVNIEAFISNRGDKNNCIVIDERGAQKGELATLLSILGVVGVNIVYFEDLAAPLDLEILSIALGKKSFGALFSLDENSGELRPLVESNLSMSLQILLNASKVFSPPDKLILLIKKMLSCLSEVPVTVLSEELRTLLIGLENMFLFLDQRSCYSACSPAGPDNGLSLSIQAAAAFAKGLEQSRSISFSALGGCVKHLQDGKSIFSHFRQVPSGNIEELFFHKAYVWLASLHLAHAKFLGSRAGYSNSAIHHCVRALELYLIAILVPAKKLFPKADGSFYSNGVKMMGVGALFGLSPLPIPPDVRNVVDLRNTSELAHGIQRWSVSVSNSCVSVIESFLIAFDASHSNGDLNRHLTNANSVDFVTLTYAWIRGFFKKIPSCMQQTTI